MEATKKINNKIYHTPKKYPSSARPTRDQLKKQGKIISGRWDSLFKHLIQDEKNRYIICKMLYLITKIDEEILLEYLSFLNTELPLKKAISKKKIADIIAKAKGNIIDLEMDNFVTKYTDYKNKSYFYEITSIIYNNKENFNKKMRIILICLENEERFKGRLIEHMTYKNDYDDCIEDDGTEIYHVSLQAVRKAWYNGLNKLDLTEEEKELIRILCMFALDDEDDLREAAKGNPDLERMVDMIITFNDVDNFGAFDKESYDEWERKCREKEAEERGVKLGEKQGIKLGEKRGEKRGKTEEKLEIAKNMLSLNIDIKIISKATGLSEEDIQKIKETE